MYKVFVNDHPLFFTDRRPVETGLPVCVFSIAEVVEKARIMVLTGEGGCYFICDDLRRDWQEIKASFVVHHAGGGKVINLEDETLFIFRNGRWDLPKGKLETDESIRTCALREVEEECGITALSIVKELETTYHIFIRKGQLILKITHWFEMRTTHTGPLKPQLEEGISRVEFLKGDVLHRALDDTYKTIKLLF